MLPDKFDVEAQNEAVGGWFGDTMQAIKNRYMQLVRGTGRSGDGFDSLRYSTYRSFGEIDRGSFRFERHLVYVHKGAGKGKGGTKGSTWTDPHGNKKSTNPLSLGKMNTGARRAEEWLNPVLDTEVPKLADIVAGFKADQAVKAIKIK